MNDILSAALRLEQDGRSIIPVGPDKVALVPWEEFQKRRASEEELLSWWEQYPTANIAMVTGAISGVDVVDWDDQSGRDYLDSYLPEVLETPCTKTPRGGGHILFQHTDGLRSKNGIFEKVDFKADGGYVILPPSRNGRGNYEWIVSFDMAELAPLPDKLIAYIKNSFSLYRGVSRESQNDSIIKSQEVSLSLKEGLRNESLFHVATLLYRGGGTDQEVSQLVEIIAESCNPPYPKKELRPLIESAKQRKNIRTKSIAETVREFCEVSRGIFKVSDYYTEYHVVSKEDKHAAILEFKRLCDAKKPIIKKHGGKRGEYKTIDSECEVIDYLNANEERMPILFPLDLHELVEIMPGNIIILAGEPNAGKTSWMFNFIQMNMFKYNITYFNSEMAPEELKKRLLKMDTPIDKWRWTVKGNADDYSDQVIPGRGNINVIDYLEVYKDFFEVGGDINNIYRKLDGALAVIAIQKNPGMVTGLGGYRTLEKARLALALSPGRLDIVKAKNWATPENPNGKYCEFKIIQGGHMYASSGWLRDKK